MPPNSRADLLRTARSIALRGPVAALIVAIAVLGVLAATAVSGQIDNEMAENAERRFARHGDEVTRAIDRLMDRVSHDIRLARQNTVIEQLQLAAGTPAEDKARSEADLALQYVGGRYDVDETCVIAADGRELARWNGGASAYAGDLSEDETEGNPLVLPALALPDDEIIRSEPYVSPDSERWVIGVATPVYSTGRAVGLLHLELPLQWFTRELVARPFGGSAYVFVMDRSGRLLVHPDLARWRLAEGNAGDPDTDPIPSARAAGSATWLAAVDGMLAGAPSGHASFEEGGRSFRVEYRLALGGDVVVASVVPEMELFADLDRARWNLLITVGPLVLLMLLLGGWFTWRLLRANRELVTANAASSQLASIVRSADDAIMSVSTDGTIWTWNEGAHRMYGHAAAEAIGRDVRLLTEPGRDTEAAQLLQTVASGEPVTRYETAHRGKDGRRFDVSLTVSPIRDSSGTVTAASLVARDVTQRKELEAQLAHQALHDALTGLPNRALFGDRLAHALARTGRPDASGAVTRVGVLFLDLDEFKVINDTLGHRVGDELLVAIADRLQGCLRPGDTAARLGGDEFTVLLENLPETAETRRVAERIIERIAAPLTLEGHRVVITASVGIATSESSADLPEDLLRNADIALYEAKAKGKARHETFDGRMTARAWQRLRLEGEIRRAIDEQELSVAFQPIVTVATGELISVEALVRWQHPERGAIAPGDFIPLAEQTGLIGPIGRMVLRTACEQMAAWRHSSPRAAAGITVSVNVSPRELPQPDFETSVLDAIRESGLSTADVRLEITEGVELLSDPAGIEKLRRLRDAGIGIAVDDFGSGYSSLGYFQQLPVDAVKIDRTFISGLGSDRQQTAIVTAALAFAKALDLEVIAEGVETNGQRSALEQLGCRRAQGYLFGRPQSGDDIARLLASAGGDGVLLPRPAASAPTPTGRPVQARPAEPRPATSPTTPLRTRPATD